MDLYADLEEQGASAAMEVDDSDGVDFFGGPEPPISAPDHPHIADADFFNSFADDFDDSDIY